MSYAVRGSNVVQKKQCLFATNPDYLEAILAVEKFCGISLDTSLAITSLVMTRAALPPTWR